MEETKETMGIQGILFRIFVLLTLFFPAVYSPLSYEEGSEYFVLISCPYVILGIYLIWTVIKGKRKERNTFFLILAAFLTFYNILSLYYNIRYLHWYGEQINNTIAIALFACLIQWNGFEGEEGKRRIRFLMACIVVSNLCSILFFALGYTSFVICNNQVSLYQLPENYYEFRHYWLYSHKSDYALQLVAFFALFVRFKKLIERKWLWWIGACVILAALILTHSWTAFVSVGCVTVGALLEKIDWKKFHWKLSYSLGTVAVCGAGGVLLAFLLKERNLATLGSRTGIWQGALKLIGEYPMGLGKAFGVYPVEAVGMGWTTNNAHNVFLNALLRCSIPVGICYCLLLFMILIYCFVRSKKKWLTLGTLGGIFLLLNMDYSLLSYELAMLMLGLHLICIYEEKTEVMEYGSLTGQETSKLYQVPE